MSGIIGTGGHIDHGKTALVAALTGEDTDRLPEEKRRGISIDLGFSRIELEGVTYGIVDVPGHEDFIRNMLAGATGMDVLLLAIAADEGVMPQTREHVAIADLLAVPCAVVALTKADLVEDAWLDLVRDDVAELLAPTRFAGAPMLAVASPAGQGIPELRAALAAAAADGTGGRRARRPADDLLRLPVDRAFTVKGTGTVVTGTVWSGALSREQIVRLEPGGPEARVRGLQVHGREVERVEAGQRAAVALAGAARDDVVRGMTLVTGAGWAAASALTVRVGVLPDSDWSVRQRQRVRVHLGTAEVMARVRLLDADELKPGDDGWAQLRLEAPLVARAGDRFVLRSFSPVTTIGGGSVAEPAAPRRKRLTDALLAALQRLTGPDPLASVQAVVEAARATGADVASLPVWSGATPAEVREVLGRGGLVVAGDLAFPSVAGDEAADRLLAAVDDHHARWPLRQGIELEELRRAAQAPPPLAQWALGRLTEEGALESREGRVARAGYRPALDAERERRLDALLDRLERAGPMPPAEEELLAAAGNGRDPPDELLRFLEAEGRVVRLQPGAYLHRTVVDRLTSAVRQRLGGRAGLGPADFKDVIDVSRKHLIPILEHLDVAGVTVRHPDGRSVPTRSAEA